MCSAPSKSSARSTPARFSSSRKRTYAIARGRQSLRVVKQNLVFALGMFVLLVASDLLRWISLPWGIVGHEGSTLLVTLNGLRLLRTVRLSRRGLRQVVGGGVTIGAG